MSVQNSVVCSSSFTVLGEVVQCERTVVETQGLNSTTTVSDFFPDSSGSFDASWVYYSFSCFSLLLIFIFWYKYILKE